jgi:hypothetical protein
METSASYEGRSAPSPYPTRTIALPDPAANPWDGGVPARRDVRDRPVMSSVKFEAGAGSVEMRPRPPGRWYHPVNDAYAPIPRGRVYVGC